MTISAERRESVLSAMDEPEHVEFNQSHLLTIEQAIYDSARLERIERKVRELIGDYDFYGEEGVRARDTAKELRAIVDTGDEENGDE